MTTSSAAQRTLERVHTLMVTDLAQFTCLLEALGDVRARELIRAHDRILRQCLNEHHGVEYAHTGDGMITSFESAAQALQCAATFQRQLEIVNRSSLAAARLHVRVGLHVGRALEEEGRLFGISVNVAVRICNAAAALQILASDDFLQALGARARPESALHLGPRLLKNVAEPIHLYELPWRSRRLDPGPPGPPPYAHGGDELHAA